jgi:2-C-methyl-D-erythritol 4-phosphate cytidylyltransferase
MEKTVIIVAGGQGMRFSDDRPKQFFYLRERPMLMHTIDLFYIYNKSMQIIVGLPESWFSYWESICEQFHFDVCHTLSSGGETRFHTVRNALHLVQTGNLVGIHDAVRPLVYKRTIDDGYRAAEESGASLPCIELQDSIRELTPGGSRHADRNAFRLVQTPQVFQYDILRKAYENEYSEEYTDDASVVEKAGFPVRIVNGNPENIKITTPDDLVYAEAIFESYRKRCGFSRKEGFSF